MPSKVILSLCFFAGSLFAVCPIVPEKGLVAFYPFDGNADSRGPVEGLDGTVHRATLSTDRFGNPNSAFHFGGSDSAYIEIPDNDVFSISTTGALTVSAWMSPDSADFEITDNGYVHWMGKGCARAQEWTLRMYNFDSERPNRISAYAFNLSGGLGAGSYVQGKVVPGEWLHIAARYDMESNTIAIFRNGEKMDQDSLYDITYKVIPENGDAPVRMGTRSLWSFFKGKIDDVRFYDRALSDDEIRALFLECPESSDRIFAVEKSPGTRSRAAVEFREGKVCVFREGFSGGAFSVDGRKVRFGR